MALTTLWDDEPAAAVDGLMLGNSEGEKLMDAEKASGCKPVSLVPL
jgi:hypothetical protein